MKTQRLTFTGASGARLSARLELPVGEQPKAFALFAHCFTCSKNYKAVVNISRALARSGLAVLRFDFTGLGESEGEFEETTFSSNVADLVAAAEYLGRERRAPGLLIGHSLGGAAVIRAARQVPSARAVVTINAPADPEHVKRHLTASLDEIERTGQAEVELGGRPFTISREFLKDLGRQSMQDALEGLEPALLVFHSPDDAIVDVENGERIISLARQPKNFVSLPGADHLLSRAEDSEYVGAVIAAWAARFLAGSRDQRDQERAAGGRDVIVRTGKARYHTEIDARGHALVSDEPEEAGGGDSGPDPFGLLMSALGACTTITLRMYADRKDWALDEVRVRVRHRKRGEDEVEDSAPGKQRWHEISQRLELVGDLDTEQRQRLLEIAERCPVHRALHAGIEVSMELVRSDR